MGTFLMVDPIVQNLFRKWSRILLPRGPTPYPLISSSGRIHLQALKSSEIKIVEEWFEDRETCELAFGVKAPWDVLSSMRSEYIEELQKDKVGVLSVNMHQGDSRKSFVGFVRYKLYHRGRKKSARVGIVLGPPSLRGQGIGREAFQTLLRYLFQDRQVQVIDLDTALFNQQAQQCFQSCGFQSLREVEFTSIHSQWTERRLMMRLTRCEWNLRQA